MSTRLRPRVGRSPDGCGPGSGGLARGGRQSPPEHGRSADRLHHAGPRLTQPVFPDIVRDTYLLPMHDGIRLYVEVVRPDVAGRRFPVIMEASPYHGTLADRDGTRILPEPRNADGRRGTGRSEGCLDHLGPDDAQDLKTIVEWAARQSWSNGRVGMTGHSYVGSTPSVAAAQNPEAWRPSFPAPAWPRCTTTRSRPGSRTSSSGPAPSGPTNGWPWPGSIRPSATNRCRAPTPATTSATACSTSGADGRTPR
jgi:hypothetical protein